MTLKEKLYNTHQKDFPISGGFGSSFEDAIIIHRDEENNYVGTIYDVINCLKRDSSTDWQLIRQALRLKDDKKYDIMHINVIKMSNLELISEEETLYFDITECFDT